MNADRIARWYRIFEYGAYGRSLEQRRFRYLSEAAGGTCGLLLGDGDGRFLCALLRRNPNMHVHYVDSSHEMLRLTARRLLKSFEEIPGTVHMHCADALQFHARERHYDLIATHFFLDCLAQDECNRLIAHLTEWALPGARWLVSEFSIPNAGIARHWARFWVWLSYLFFRMVTGLRTRHLPDYAGVFKQNGWMLEQQEISRTGLLVSQIWRRTC